MSEVRSAVRALLSQPLLDRRDQAALSAVRSERTEVARFFAEELGYRLDASRAGVVRLAKMPSGAHVARGLHARSGRRFDPRRYALVCLVLAAAESAGERTTLARLFEEVVERAAGLDALAFDENVAAERRAFVQAVQAVVDLGVLELAEGDEERFARGDSGGDALYRIDRERLALLPTAPQPPSLVSRWTDLAAEAYPETDEGRVRRRRHRVMRALVEQPVVYLDDLSGDELDYLRSQRPRIERLLAERVGLALEVRAEGFVAVDESAELGDLRWPDYGAPETAALRICDELASRHRRGDGVWAFVDVVAFVASLAHDYAGYWRRDADDPGEAVKIARAAVQILCDARLVAVDGDSGLTARGAAARFAAAPADRRAQADRGAPPPAEEER